MLARAQGQFSPKVLLWETEERLRVCVTAAGHKMAPEHQQREPLFSSLAAPQGSEIGLAMVP